MTINELYDVICQELIHATNNLYEPLMNFDQARDITRKIIFRIIGENNINEFLH